MKKLNEGDINGAANAMEQYNKISKKVEVNGKKEIKKVYSKGLANRRKKEIELFLTPDD